MTPLKQANIAISVVVPVWNEAKENIRELYSRLTRVLSGSRRSYEIVFVDNASDAEIFNILHGLYNGDSGIKIVRLTKNFGQAAALLAGFEYSSGQTIVTMDSDLQCYPEDLPRLIEKIDAGFDAVSGSRVNRCDPFFTRMVPSYIMNKIITLRTGVKLRDWGSSFCAIKKSKVECLKAYGMNARFIKPLVSQITDIAEIEIGHNRKNIRGSKYTILDLVLVAFDFLINYSTRPKGAYGPLFAVQEIYQKDENRYSLA